MRAMGAPAVAERTRLDALHGLSVLDTEPEERFDRVARTAAALFRVPIALVSLVDADRQWAKACIGLANPEAPRSTSFCAVAIERPAPLVVPDARDDPRFAHFALVTGEPHLRFYAGHPVHAPGGEPVGTLCIADVVPRELSPEQLEQLGDLAAIAEAELARTDLAVALAARRESEDRARAVMEHIGDGIITFGPDGVVRSANPAAELAFATAPGGLAGARVDELLAGVDWDALRARLPAVVGKRRLVTGRRADGGTFPLELLISATSLDGERVFIAVGQDVSQRQAVEARLRASEQRFRAVFDGAATGIGLIDPDGMIVSANAALCEMLGYPADEMVGLTAAAVTHPDDLEEDARLAAELFAGRCGGYHREKRYVRRDGTLVWGALAASLLVGEDGERPLAIGMIEDITERKEVERLKDEFVSVVGHELRTPLTSIRGSLGLLAAGVAGPLGGEAADMVRIALENTERLIRLVEDTLDLERMQAGREAMTLTAVTAAHLVNTSLRVLEQLAADAGVALRAEVPDIEVLADGDRVVQALTNLVGNAVKFSPAGGTVTISARTEGRRAVVCVRDEGRGIPPDQLDAIFERFRQVDATDRREKGGTGLGLAIAREIVLQHRGRIWAESEPGHGSTFSFTLPLPGSALTIAVCDRRARAREELAERLRSLGQRAVGYESAEAVVAAAELEGLAAVVLPLGPASGEVIAALDANAATAELPKLVLKGPHDETGLLSVLEAAVPALRPGRVLVVEDDPDLGRLLTVSLGRDGRDVQLARTGREAREAIERAEPSLVVLDLGLPGEDGFSVVDWLRERGALAGVPLLVYTARSLGEDDRERLQLGTTEFLDKVEVPPDELDRRVNELLECVAGGLR